MQAEPSGTPPPATVERSGADFAGAVYGSLLAASVVVGTSPRDGAPEPRELIILLLATGLVFWLTHVYAHLVGDRVDHTGMSWGALRAVARREAPLAQAAVPPALAATVALLLGLSDVGVAWVALVAAIAGMVGWAAFAAARAGASRPLIIVSGVGNLFLGLLLIALKTALSH